MRIRPLPALVAAAMRQLRVQAARAHGFANAVLWGPDQPYPIIVPLEAMLRGALLVADVMATLDGRRLAVTVHDAVHAALTRHSPELATRGGSIAF